MYLNALRGSLCVLTMQDVPHPLPGSQGELQAADARAANAEAQMQEAGDVGEWIGVDSTLEVRRRYFSILSGMHWGQTG